MQIIVTKQVKPVYSRKILLRLVLMCVLNGGLSGRQVAAKTAMDVSYMYLVAWKTRFQNNQ